MVLVDELPMNSIVICNCRIVPAMQMALQVVLVEELPDGVLKEVSHEMRF